MTRLMSVAYTEDAVVARIKTETRRKGWCVDKNGRRLLAVGDRLTLCRKVMGRKAGEPLVRLVDVEVTGVRRERLDAITPEAVAAEGFPGMTPADFIDRFFVTAQGIQPDRVLTVITWRYLEPEADLLSTIETGAA